MLCLIVQRQFYSIALSNRMIAVRQPSSSRIDYSILEVDANQITKNIYIGDKKSAKNLGFLRQLGVKHIVIAGQELTPHYPECFNYLHLKVLDSPKENISAHFDEVYTFIQNALKKEESVLVHCAYGVSRSSTLVLAFLMKKFKIGYSEAFVYARRKRPIIKPNYGFQKQLRAWGEELTKIQK